MNKQVVILVEGFNNHQSLISNRIQNNTYIFETFANLKKSQMLPRQFCLLAHKNFQQQTIDFFGSRIASSLFFNELTDEIFLWLQVKSQESIAKSIHDYQINEWLDAYAKPKREQLAQSIFSFDLKKIFSCRNLPSLQEILLEILSKTAPLDQLRLYIHPEYASLDEMQDFDFAAPILEDETILAYIYFSIKASQSSNLQHMILEISNKFYLLKDIIKLVLLRNKALLLAEEEALVWNSSFHAIEDPLIILTENFKVVQANNAYLKLIEKDIDTVTGKECDLFENSELYAYKDFNSKEWDLQIHKKYFRVFMDKIEEPLGLGRYVLRLHDVSEEKILRDEIIATQQSADLGILVSSVAHDLNNPIGGILALTQLLQTNSDIISDQEFNQALTNIKGCAERIKIIIHTLLDLARTNSDESTVFKLDECLKDVFELLTIELRRTKIDLKTSNLVSADINGSKNSFTQAILHLFRQSMNSILERRKLDSSLRGEVEVKIELIDKRQAILVIYDNGLACLPAAHSSVMYNVVKLLLDQAHIEISYDYIDNKNVKCLAIQTIC